MGVIPSAGMADHKKVCPLEVVPCSYFTMGCEARMTRRDMEKHNTTEMAYHLKLTNQAFLEINNDIKEAKSEQEILHDKINLLTLNNNKMHSVSAEMYRVKNTQMKQQEETEEFQEQIRIAQLKIRELKVLLSISALIFVVVIIYAAWITIRLYPTSSQLWRLSIAQNSCLDMCTDGIAPVIVKMSNFTEIKENKEEWYSGPFLAFNNGYQMRLRVNILDDFSSLQVTLQLLKGPYDDELDKKHYFPLQMLASIELLNQAQDNYHYFVPVMLHTHSCGACAKRVVETVYSQSHNYTNSFTIPQSVITKQDHFYVHNNQLNLRVSVSLMQEHYFVMSLY